MNIEQIAHDVSSEMSKEAKAMEGRAMMVEFFRRCLSKLAEQDAEPVAFAFKHSLLGVLYDFSETEHSNGMVRLYTETQLLAAQQRTAEACAKVCEAVRAEDGDGQHRAWYAGIDMCIDAIRNGDWREHL